MKFSVICHNRGGGHLDRVPSHIKRSNHSKLQSALFSNFKVYFWEDELASENIRLRTSLVKYLSINTKFNRAGIFVDALVRIPL